MTTTIITTVLGALCVAGIIAMFKSRWLYVIAPRLYLNTPLSDGQIVSLTIINTGLLSEEDVAVTFRSACKFELIATSKSTLTVTGRTLSLPKLSRAESVSVLLLIEGKGFDPADIDSIESKSTKGKIVESKEKAIALWQSILIIPLFIAALGLPFLFGTFIGAEMGAPLPRYIEEKLEIFGNRVQLAGYKNDLTENYSSVGGKLSGSLKAGVVQIEVPEIMRRGDVLTITIKTTNNSSNVLFVNAGIEGTAGKGPLDYSDTRAESFGLGPKESKTIKFKAFVPEKSTVKIVKGTYRFETPAGEYLHITQTLTF